MPARVTAAQLLALCLLFLSVLTTAFYTLVETDRDAAVACVVGGRQQLGVSEDPPARQG